MSRWIDGLVAILKWPVAVAGLLALPALVGAVFDLLIGLHTARPILPLLLGALGFAVVWYAVLHRPAFARWATFEHELTHALFALLTLHRTVGLVGTLRSGGHVRYLGKGNWLIAIAPFVVPIFAVALAALMSALPRHALVYAGAFLGVALAYHGLATWSRLHRHAGDLREVGTIFTLLFVPAATLLVYGLVLALVTGGGRGVQHFVGDAFGRAVSFAHVAWSWLSSLRKK